MLAPRLSSWLEVAQVVRLAMLRPPKTGRQLTYRVIAARNPRGRQAVKPSSCKLPWRSRCRFYYATGAKHWLGCSVERSAGKYGHGGV